jgi:hypothetical protein
MVLRVCIFSVVLSALSSVVIADEHQTIFDGESLIGWTMENGDPVRGEWEVVDGAIHLSTGHGGSGNIVTAEEYGDFELKFEWKISEGGNSGIKYRVRQFDNRWLGCEYQILDDSQHRDAQRDKTSTASLYDVYPPGAGKYLKPVGEYNQSRIVVCGHRLEHWLNGEMVLEAWVGSWEWYERIGESKFSDVYGFGQNRFGKIMLTDHHSEVWYRNLQLTLLTDCYVPQYTSPSERTAAAAPSRRMGLLQRLRCRRAR